MASEPKEDRVHFLVLTDVCGDRTYGVVAQYYRPLHVGVPATAPRSWVGAPFHREPPPRPPGGARRAPTRPRSASGPARAGRSAQVDPRGRRPLRPGLSGHCAVGSCTRGSGRPPPLPGLRDHSGCPSLRLDTWAAPPSVCEGPSLGLASMRQPHVGQRVLGEPQRVAQKSSWGKQGA